jgi:hypothetical protein
MSCYIVVSDSTMLESTLEAAHDTRDRLTRCRSIVVSQLSLPDVLCRHLDDIAVASAGATPVQRLGRHFGLRNLVDASVVDVSRVAFRCSLRLADREN